MKAGTAIIAGISIVILFVCILLYLGPADVVVGNTFTLTFESYSMTPEPDVAYYFRGVLTAHNAYVGTVMLSLSPLTHPINTPYLICEALGEVNFNDMQRQQAVIIEVGISHTCLPGVYRYTVAATDYTVTRTATLTVSVSAV